MVKWFSRKVSRSFNGGKDSFQQTVLGKPDRHMQKNKVRTYTIYKNKIIKMDQSPKC